MIQLHFPQQHYYSLTCLWNNILTYLYVHTTAITRSLFTTLTFFPVNLLVLLRVEFNCFWSKHNVLGIIEAMAKLIICPKLTSFGTQGSRLIFLKNILQITLITSQLFVSQCPFSYAWECLIEMCMLQELQESDISGNT